MLPSKSYKFHESNLQTESKSDQSLLGIENISKNNNHTNNENLRNKKAAVITKKSTKKYLDSLQGSVNGNPSLSTIDNNNNNDNNAAYSRNRQSSFSTDDDYQLSSNNNNKHHYSGENPLKHSLSSSPNKKNYAKNNNDNDYNPNVDFNHPSEQIKETPKKRNGLDLAVIKSSSSLNGLKKNYPNINLHNEDTNTNNNGYGEKVRSPTNAQHQQQQQHHFDNQQQSFGLLPQIETNNSNNNNGNNGGYRFREEKRNGVKKVQSELKLPMINDRSVKQNTNSHSSKNLGGFLKDSSASAFNSRQQNGLTYKHLNQSDIDNNMPNRQSYNVLFSNANYPRNTNNNNNNTMRHSMKIQLKPVTEQNPLASSGIIRSRGSSPHTDTILNGGENHYINNKRGSSKSEEKAPVKNNEDKSNNNNLFVEETPKLVYNYSFKSKAGSLPSKPVKTNQDSYIVNTSFGGDKSRYFFGVSDGHGLNGHLVSGFIKHNLPKNIDHYLKSKNYSDDNGIVKQALHEGFLQTNKELLESNIDCNYSGSTTVTVLIMGNHIWCSNVGDSRAIMAKFKNSEWIPIPLSNDHKPDEQNEMQRILASGGRVEPFKDLKGDPVGPNRVWLKNENVPGLAMARSFGDIVASQAGVIHEPETWDFELTEEDKFIIIASDGLWEFISNKQVINYIIPFYNKNLLDAACDKLIRSATQCWKQEDDVVDDITCVIIGLKPPLK